MLSRESFKNGHPNVPKDYTKLTAAVEAFCWMVDYLESYPPLKWLKAMHRLLPQLEAEMERLDVEPEGGFFAVSDLEPRFSMFCRIKAFLGEWDEYALEGESEAFGDCTGSLADDFTDLYFELRRGLILSKEDLEAAVVLWRTGYVLHWSTHLREARKRLEALSRRGAW